MCDIMLFKTLSSTSSNECEVCNCSRLLTNSIRLTPGSPRFRDTRRIHLNDKCNMDLENGNKENLTSNSMASVIEKSPAKLILSKHNSLASPRHSRNPLEDHDTNSQDSGFEYLSYSQDSNNAPADRKMGFRFPEPLAVAPRRFNSESPERVPRKSLIFSDHPNSVSSLESDPNDDGFAEIFSESDKEDEFPQSPCLNSLLSAPIKVITPMLKEETESLCAEAPTSDLLPTPSPSRDIQSIPSSSESSQASSSSFILRPPLRRSLSLFDSNVTPRTSGSVRNLFNENRLSALSNDSPSTNSPSLEFLRKRSEPFSSNNIEIEQMIKRRRSCMNENREPITPCTSSSSTNQDIATADTDTEEVEEEKVEKIRPALLRFFSENDATIDRALQRASLDPDLIGDFSRPFALPLMPGRHEDLKSISCDTLADLILGKFHDLVETYTIVDCRYPYEYNGGHIRGAKNIYTRDQVLKEFVQAKNKANVHMGKRHILIFHCEFSSERGPRLSRFLRSSDRVQNEYPALYYPELYLLHGGYKNFFEQHSELCDPRSYLPMLDPGHESDLRHFRNKSKSWTGDNKNRIALRHNLKRLGL